jgi:hypothetical protein
MPERIQLSLLDDPVEIAASNFLDQLRAEGLDDDDLKLAVLKVFYRHTSDQLRRYPPKLRDRFILWLVEEFLEND